jgi:hypothetical protein
MHSFSSSRWLRFLQGFRMALLVPIALGRLHLRAQAQGKERPMEHPTFYRTDSHLPRGLLKRERIQTLRILLIPFLPPNRAKSVACYGAESVTVWLPPRCANAAAAPAAAAPARPRRIQRV